MNAAAPALKEEFRVIPLDKLQPSKSNPRRHFDKEADAQLAESIKAQGIIEPIVVRPLSGDKFEIVAGERRFRASKVAGRTDLPAVIRNYSDRQALQAQIVENLQRRDVRPLEEAAAFAKLMDKKEMGEEALKAEQIAEQIGMSVEYVHARVKLNALAESPRKLMEEGKLKTEHAVMIARLNEGDQKRAAEYCVNRDPTVKSFRVYVDEEIKKAAARQTIANKLAEVKKNGERGVLISQHNQWQVDTSGYPKNTLYKDGYKVASRPCDAAFQGVIVDWSKAGQIVLVCVAEKCRVHTPEKFKEAKKESPKKKATKIKAATEQAAKRTEQVRKEELEEKAKELAQERTLSKVVQGAKLDLVDLRFIAKVAAQTVYLTDNDIGGAVILRRRGIKVDNVYSQAFEKALYALVDQARTEKDLLRLIFEFSVCSAEDHTDSAYKRYGANLADIEKATLKELVDQDVAAAKTPTKIKVQTSTKQKSKTPKKSKGKPKPKRGAKKKAPKKK